MHEIQMRRRRRLRYEFGKQAEQDTKYSHSHTHSHSRIALAVTHTHRTRLALVSRVVRTIARRKQSDDTILYLFAAALGLSLFLACVAGPVGCGRARRITKTKLSTICARPFFAAYLMVSVFSFSTSKIPIRQQHTHTRHAHPCKRTCHVYVCLQNFHTHTQWVYFIYFRYISPRLQSEIFLLEILHTTHTQMTACFSVTFFQHFLTTQLPLPAEAAAGAAPLNFTHKSIHNEIDGLLLLLTLLHLPTHTHMQQYAMRVYLRCCCCCCSYRFLVHVFIITLRF